jgi:hypothetical protein
VKTAVRYTTTFLEHWFHPWRGSFVDNDKILSPEATREFINKVEISVDLPDQRYIVISKDRASLVFSNWQDRIKNRSAWHTPLAISLSLLPTLVVANFPDTVWCAGKTAKGILAAFFMGAVIWMLRDLIRLCRTKNVTPEKFIEVLSAGTTSFAMSGDKLSNASGPSVTQ